MSIMISYVTGDPKDWGPDMMNDCQQAHYYALWPNRSINSDRYSAAIDRRMNGERWIPLSTSRSGAQPAACRSVSPMSNWVLTIGGFLHDDADRRYSWRGPLRQRAELSLGPLSEHVLPRLLGFSLHYLAE